MNIANSTKVVAEKSAELLVTVIFNNAMDQINQIIENNEQSQVLKLAIAHNDLSLDAGVILNEQC